VQKTVTLKSPVNLNKHSLQLIPSEEKGIYDIQFTFDSSEEIVAKLYYVASETFDKETKSIVYTSNITPSPVGVPLAQGLGQAFVTTKEQQLNINAFKEEDLVENGNTSPVIILLQALNVNKDESIKRITTQTTIATLLKCNDGTFEIKPVKQKIEYGGLSYLVHDIYGTDEGREISEECVICMTEARNTVVIPCRHMCLCHQCAEVLRHQSNKCPICRGPVRSLLKIEISTGASKESVPDSKEVVPDSKEVVTEEKEGDTEMQLLKKSKKKKDVSTNQQSPPNIQDT